MTRFASHIAIAAAALVAGGFGATAFSSPESARDNAAVPTQTAPPEQVRTVVVTKTIHRVRHVRVHHKAVAAPAVTSAVAVAPARPRYVPVAAPRPVVAPATTHPLKTRTSGHGASGESEHEGGGDD